MKKIAVYPGSFDPFTNGHLDIVRRASQIFDLVYVAVLKNSSKKPLFPVGERMELISMSTADISNIIVSGFEGLLIDYMKTVNATFIVRGLRAVSDFEYEFQMALTNNKLDNDVETVFLAANNQYQFLSSSIVKEIAKYGGCLDDFVPDSIAPILKSRYSGGN